MRLQSEVGELLWMESAGGGNIMEIEQEHRGILQALTSGDSVLAGALAEAHVTRGIKRLLSLRLELMAEANEG